MFEPCPVLPAKTGHQAGCPKSETKIFDNVAVIFLRKERLSARLRKYA